MKQIETLFWEKGYRNLNGKKIAHTTMSNMISNPKYKGYYVGNKVKVVDMFTKKQKFLPPEEWVMFKDETGEIVPAIVSEELWEQANAVLLPPQRGRKEPAGRLQPRQSADRKALLHPLRHRLLPPGVSRTDRATKTASGSAPARSKTARTPALPSPSTRTRSSPCCWMCSAIRRPAQRR